MRGKYIVLEGPEGVGKTTQLMELAQRLRSAGLPVRTLREPDSQSDLTARTIRHITQDPRYPLNTRSEVLLYNAARAQSLEIISRSVEQGIYCLVDRNYLTTLAIQYYGRGDVPDYETINNIISFAVGGVEPDLTILLDAPVPVLRERLKDRYSAERFDNLDDEFLERVRAGYLWEAKQRQLPVIFATDSPEMVADKIWELVSHELQTRTKSNVAAEAPAATSVKEILAAKNDDKPHNRYLVKEENGYTITEDGEIFLAESVTNVTGNVYAFTDKLNPITIAAAMARLSRRGDDMRITILDEFADKADKDAELLQRVITAYGDDSVQQLVGQHVVVENASNLLTKKLEWGRLASYLEQSTRYIYFDQKDKKGKYKYYVPENLDAKTKKKYVASMDVIFGLYSEIVRNLTEYVQAQSTTPKEEQDGAWRAATRAQACDAARPLLPVAVQSTVGIFASGQSLESLIMHLQSDELHEARTTGQQILDETRQVIPAFLERADKPERGGAMIAYRANTRNAVKEMAEKLLPAGHASVQSDDAVQLTDVWPMSELDILPDMLYEFSDLSLEEIRDHVSSLSYDKRLKAFQSYFGERLNRRHRPGRALEKAHYSFDLLCDYGIFRDLQRHRMVDDLEWQTLTPRYGYEIPELVERAGLTDAFEKCFEVSLALYSELQAAGYKEESQYATLLGHKMRWKVTLNARAAFHFCELRTAPQGHPGYRKLTAQMYEKIKQVHPLIAEAMKFVNQDEDPELTRLAAERATQFKLQALDGKRQKPNKK